MRRAKIAGNRPFLYLVKDDEAYVVNGPAEFGGGERVSQYLQRAWNDRTAARIRCNRPEGPLSHAPARSKIESNAAISSNSLQSM